ncbi:hypothetical protein AAHA92_28650 [Salvia divinorum]|uniref:SURP motif domain-containing protein n=1 Tax=Salvia divinorum TaxID=28513 RepID=A0ABD1FY90_SALDI
MQLMHQSICIDGKRCSLTDLEYVAPPSPPSDPTVKNVADKHASFVAKNGRQFEHVTRQKNPGDAPFKRNPLNNPRKAYY